MSNSLVPPYDGRAFAAALACLLWIGAGCASDATDLMPVDGEPDPTVEPDTVLQSASVSLGVTCGAEGEQTVVVITESQAGCAEHAALLAGGEVAGKSLVVTSPDLEANLHLESSAMVCEGGACNRGELEIDLEAGADIGSLMFTLDGERFTADFETRRCDFLGASALAADLEVQEVALYQGTRVQLAAQGGASLRTVPVVQGRPGLVRVFVAPQAGFQAREISAELVWARGDGTEPTTYAESMRVVAASNESQLGTSFDFTLSAEDMTGNARWSVALRETTICAKGTPSALAATPADGEMLELGAQAISGLKVVLVPVRYDADGTGRLPDTSEAQLERYREAIFSQYPITDVAISVRDPMPWSDTIDADGTGWTELLQALLVQRARDGAAPTEYYYGIFAPDVSFGRFCRRGCVLGLGPVAEPDEPLYRGAIGLGFSGDASAETAVHELGHAHGRLHAPCGVNDSDPGFPYASGGIGEWGYNILDGTLLSPGENSDFMSYCEPTWVSDYTYAALAERIAYVNQAPSFDVSGPAQTWRMLSLSPDAASWGGSFETARVPAGPTVEVAFHDAQGNLLEVARATSNVLDHLQTQLLLVPPAPAGTTVLMIDGRAVAY